MERGHTVAGPYTAVIHVSCSHVDMPVPCICMLGRLYAHTRAGDESLGSCYQHLHVAGVCHRQVLMATGRYPKVDGLGLENVGVKLGERMLVLPGCASAWPLSHSPCELLVS